jgi:hypothetical protein
MKSELEEILKMFEIDEARHPEMILLRDTTLKQCTTPQKAALLLLNLEEDNKGFGHQPEYRALCALCKAYAYEKIGETRFRDLLEKEVNTAIELLRSAGNKLNEGISRWFLGVVYQINGDENKAIFEFERAIATFGMCAESHGTRNQYLQQIYCDEHCGLIRYSLSKAYRTQGSKSLSRNETKESIKLLESCLRRYKEMESKYKGFQDEEHKALAHKRKTDCEKRLRAIKNAPKPPKEKIAHKPPVANEDYLAVSWMPIYQSIQAGADGPAWISPPKEDIAAFPFVLLGGKLRAITLLKGSGNQLTLTPDRIYGWAPVKGQSMNNSTPVKLEDGDYVLFENAIGPGTRQPVNRDIVIVSQPGNGGSTYYMVKRFRGADLTIISETTEKGEQYQALRLNENRQILGIVLAVAKQLI